MRAFYNEIDRYCCDWLQNLMDAGLITPGKIDDRSIADLSPDDVRGYERAHFFAGIAGWEQALSLSQYAGPVWTGSCPCQPFSAAGKGKASGDERHLWPVWFKLIRACRPPIIFGEQVEAAIGWGWLDLVCSDLEEEGYSVGASVLPACGVGAPHIRQRLWFVANAKERTTIPAQDASRTQRRGAAELRAASTDGELANADEAGRGEQRIGGILNGERQAQRHNTDGCSPSFMGDAKLLGSIRGSSAGRQAQRRAQHTSGMGNASHANWRPGERAAQKGVGADGERRRGFAESGLNHWSNLIWLPCTDGKQRPTQSSIFPLAHGVSGILVMVCAECGKETQIDETLLGSSNDRKQWPQTGSETVFGSELREMRNGRAKAGTPPQGRKPNKQRSGEHRNTLHEMPPTTPCPTTQEVDLHSLRGDIHSEMEAQDSEMLFCRVCERVGPHLRIKTLARSRVKMLRAAGNAIVPQIAAEFIKASRKG